MRFSWKFWRVVIEEIEAPKYVQTVFESPGFPIHPSASEIAEQMLVDPEVLKNETYEPGLYDESGDYYPQYTDDPSSLPDGEFIAPNSLGGDTVPESSPVENTSSSDSEVSSDVNESS